jgi:hypothetical protein
MPSRFEAVIRIASWVTYGKGKEAMKEQWEQESADLRAELEEIRKQLHALETKQGGAHEDERTLARWRLSKRMRLVVLPVIVLLAAGSVLYGQGAMDALFIDQDGKVGIGTTKPNNTLDVRGRAHMHSLAFTDGSGESYSHNWIGMADNILEKTKWLHIGGIIDGGQRRLALFADTTYVSGKVGIGTTKPNATLDIGGTGNTDKQTSLQLRSGNDLGRNDSNQITFGWNGSDTYRHTIKTRHADTKQAGNAIDFYVWKWDEKNADKTAIGGLHTMTLDGGKVGIGTIAPEQMVDIRSHGKKSPFAIDNTLFLGSLDGTARVTNNAYIDENGTWQIRDAKKKAFTLEIRNNGQLELYGTVTDGQTDWRKMATFDAANNTIEFPSKAPITVAGNLTVSGDIWYQGYKFVYQTGAFANSYNVEAASDRRLKKDIDQITKASEKVRKLSGVTYHWNDDALRYFTSDIETTVSAGPHATVKENQKAWQAERDKRYEKLSTTNVGVIAQEVEAVLPEAVTTDENGYKSVKYHYLIVLLIEAFKEQEKTVQDQARVVAQQQQEIARLTSASLAIQQQVTDVMNKQALNVSVHEK